MRGLPVRLVAVGMLLILADLRVGTFDLLPDVVGAVLVLVGLAEIRNEAPGLQTAWILAWVMLGLALVGLASLAVWPLFIVVMVGGFILTVWFMWVFIEGILAAGGDVLARCRQRLLNARTAWIALHAALLFIVPMMFLGGAFLALVALAAALAVGIYLTLALFEAARALDDSTPELVSPPTTPAESP